MYVPFCFKLKLPECHVSTSLYYDNLNITKVRDFTSKHLSTLFRSVHLNFIPIINLLHSQLAEVVIKLRLNELEHRTNARAPR